MIGQIFLQINTTQLAVGSGELVRQSQPSSIKPSFYINDFFLTKKDPWIVPEHFELTSLIEARRGFPATQLPAIQWNKVDTSRFEKTFAVIQDRIASSTLKKAVPVLFEEGTCGAAEPLLAPLSSALLCAAAKNLHLFGYEQDGEGIAGLSPEILFEQKENRIVSSALAGTQSTSLNPDAIHNPKDIAEHQFVIDDLKDRLSSFGTVTVEETTAFNVGSLMHLRAAVSVNTHASPLFSEIVQKLHPTAALGVYPRNEETNLFLRATDEGVRRNLFGAPVGLRFPNGDGICIVAIRSISWERQHVRIGSGCGIIRESQLESELEELRLKRESVKEKLFPASHQR